MRLLVTASSTLKGVRANMLTGIRSMKQHGVACHRIVLANPAQLDNRQREKLRAAAKEQGAIVEEIYGREFFVSRLRRDGEWRSRLLGLSADPISLSRLPGALAESPWIPVLLPGLDAAAAPVTRHAEFVLTQILVPEEHLTAANALQGIQFDLAYVLGPLLAGLLTDVGGGRWAWR